MKASTKQLYNLTIFLEYVSVLNEVKNNRGLLD
jgi:hypothetical protein